MVRFLFIKGGLYWHKIVSTLAQSCPFAVNPYLLYLVQSKLLHSSRSGLERLFSISVKVVVSILFQKPGGC